MIVFVNFPVLNALSLETTERWLHEIARLNGFIIKGLSYTFVDNQKILEINKSFLNHDYFTDIITFDYCKGKRVSGEIFISSEQVAIQSKEFEVTISQEFLRVIAHGLLHLIGFDDKDRDDKILMRQEEEKCLVLHSQIIGV